MTVLMSKGSRVQNQGRRTPSTLKPLRMKQFVARFTRSAIEDPRFLGIGGCLGLRASLLTVPHGLGFRVIGLNYTTITTVCPSTLF